MGIQGLLPFLKKIHTPVDISQFSGCTVAIDAYCWLHKGAFSCADKLALGEKTEQYVYYCMKYVDMLLRNGLKPILVFDGCHLPSKKDVETSRRERREVNRKRAAQLLREGKRAEARECLQRCIDITPQMALELMNVCRARGVDCIVAPYEADAQLAYLNKAGIAQIIVTEDSDLLLFGCEKVIFKMDFFGNGVLIEQSRLNEVVDMQDGFYSFEKFRYMCILSGCDYLPSLPGIGLVKACKVFKVARQTDLKLLLKKVPSYLKMGLVVPDDYIEGFIRANNTFLYQLIFDPLTYKLCPLTPYTPEVDLKDLRYAGPYFSNQRALQIALGNVDIHSLEKIADFDPETYVPKYAKNQETQMLHMLSIWKPGYRPRGSSKMKMVTDAPVERPCLLGKEAQVKNALPKRSPVKRARQVEESTEVKTDTELVDLYSMPVSRGKRKLDADDSSVSWQVPDPFDSDKDSESPKSKKTAKKKVLSPSKSTNQMQRRNAHMTADEAFSLMDQEPAVDGTPQEKENSKTVKTPSKKNKFAVSALVKKARFSLDAPAMPGMKVEVKSRYFGSNTSTTPGSATSQTSPATNDSSALKAQAVSLQSSNDFIKQTTSSPCFSKKDAYQKSEFIHSSDNQPASRLKPSESICSSGKTASTKDSQAKKSSKSSPGSLFSWSSFKFAKSNITPNISTSIPTGSGSSNPFKRVVSEERSFDFVGDEGDTDKAQQKMGDSCHLLSPDSSQKSESISEISGSQQSTEEMDASQRSNLYSLDSDCFPGSQDIINLTDCDADSQSLNSGDDSTSLASTPKMQLISPKSATGKKTGTSSKKCRVPGLSRGNKKSVPVVEDKQQKIRDIFSRFSHQKRSSMEHAEETSLDVGIDSVPGTPGNPLRIVPAETLRKLVL